MANKSHLTAIGRKTISAPMRGLSDKGLITGRALDYGCGKGYDVRAFGMESYDPHYQPNMPGGLFDTIVCNFVLNVIESDSERLRVMRDIQSRLATGGKAYLTVRNDRRYLNGTTSKGTWQGLIVLALSVVQRSSGSVTYVLGESVDIDQSIQMALTF